MECHPVWVSSISHLHRTVDLFQRTSAWRKLCGGYRFEPDQPHLFLPRVPVCFFASGTLTFSDEVVWFRPRPLHVFGFKVRGLDPTFTFKLSPSDVLKIGRYVIEVPPAELPASVNAEWVRMRAGGTGIDEDLLLCIGGSFPEPSRVETKTLLSNLTEFRWTAPLRKAG